ncbi:hypothetical protein GCM10017673_20950 [Streptosporangium violaceochromogenes]|nr:hypothetical protein GCM10017673_20950 [Streptosporangium violaceochromogenes]
MPTSGDTPPTGPPARVVLAEYYVGEGATYVFGVTADADRPDIVPVEVSRADLRNLADAVRGTLSGDPAGLAGHLADERMRRLVAPLRRWAAPGDVVCLVPHDVLSLLPLHAVPLGDGPLTDRNPVVSVPSASALRRRAGRGRRPDTALIVTGLWPGRQEAFAGEQSLAVARWFGGPEILTGGQASREELLTRLRGTGTPAGVLHFAAHGVLDAGEPMRSGIELAGGRLTAEDILGLRLDVDLVTLGACRAGEDGHAPRHPGDGLAGLTRALLYAGASAALLALWQVDALPAGMLLGSFYAGLRDGTPKAEALRRARSWLRERTVADVLDHAVGARARLAGDPAAVAAVRLEEGRLHLAARDAATAIGVFSSLLAGNDLTGEQRHAAEVGMLRARLAAGRGAGPDFGLRVFTDPRHWAPFVLVGDWR